MSGAREPIDGVQKPDAATIGGVAGLEELLVLRRAWQSMVLRWALSPGQLGAALPEGGWDDLLPPLGTERRMRLMTDVDRALPFRLETAELDRWLANPIDELGGLCPIELILRGERSLRELHRFASRSFGS